MIKESPCVVQAQKIIGTTTDYIPFEIDKIETKQILLTNCEDAVFIINLADDTIVNCSLSVENILGYKPEEVIGHDTIFLHENKSKHQQFNWELLSALDSNGEYRKKFNMRRKDGSLFCGKYKAVEIVNNIQQGRHYILVININEKEQIVEHLRHSQRLITIGTITAAAIHQLNTPLSVISGYLQMFLDDLEIQKDGKSIKKIKKMLGNTTKMTNIIRGLLKYSRKSTTEEWISVDSLIDEILHYMDHEATQKHIHLIKLLKGDLPKIKAESNKLEQVFLNIMINAFDAMPDGGRLLIITGITTIDKTDHIFIDFTDSGSGMSNEIIDKIFAPYYTTKPMERGTGLGMYICNEIIKEFNGRIVINSIEGKGSSVKVVIPVVGEKN